MQEGPRQDRRFAPRAMEEPEPRQIGIYKRDLDQHGPTDGCRACAALMEKGHCRGHAHSGECRLRLEPLIANSERGRSRKEKADKRLNEAVIRQEEGDQAQGEQEEQDDAMQEEKNDDEKKVEGDDEQKVEGDKNRKRRAEDHEEEVDGRRAEPQEASSGSSGASSSTAPAGTERGARGFKRREADGELEESEGPNAGKWLQVSDPDLDADSLEHDSISAASMSGTYTNWEPTTEVMRITKVMAGRKKSAVIAEEVRGTQVRGRGALAVDASSSSRPVGTDEVAGPQRKKTKPA